jgi:hypothetical protein
MGEPFSIVDMECGGLPPLLPVTALRELSAVLGFQSHRLS